MSNPHFKSFNIGSYVEVVDDPRLKDLAKARGIVCDRCLSGESLVVTLDDGSVKTIHHTHLINKIPLRIGDVVVNLGDENAGMTIGKVGVVTSEIIDNKVHIKFSDGQYWLVRIDKLQILPSYCTGEWVTSENVMVGSQVVIVCPKYKTYLDICGQIGEVFEVHKDGYLTVKSDTFDTRKISMCYCMKVDSSRDGKLKARIQDCDKNKADTPIEMEDDKPNDEKKKFILADILKNHLGRKFYHYAANRMVKLDEIGQDQEMTFKNDGFVFVTDKYGCDYRDGNPIIFPEKNLEYLLKDYESIWTDWADENNYPRAPYRGDYYYINFTAQEIIKTNDTHCSIDNSYYNKRNYFLNIEDAEEKLNKIIAILNN